MKYLLMLLLAVFLGGCDQTDYQEDPVDNRETVDVIFIGDSFAAMGDWEEYFPDLLTVNEGVGGETTNEISQRIPGIIAQYKPCKVVLIGGINDISGGSRSVGDIYEVYMDNTDLLTDSGFEVIVTSTCYLADLGWWYDQVNSVAVSLNSLLEQGCLEKGLKYIDLAGIVCPTGYLDELFDYGDGTHLNDAGYQMWVLLLNSILLGE